MPCTSYTETTWNSNQSILNDCTIRKWFSFVFDAWRKKSIKAKQYINFVGRVFLVKLKEFGMGNLFAAATKKNPTTLANSQNNQSFTRENRFVRSNIKEDEEQIFQTPQWIATKLRKWNRKREMNKTWAKSFGTIWCEFRSVLLLVLWLWWSHMDIILLNILFVYCLYQMPRKRLGNQMKLKCVQSFNFPIKWPWLFKDYLDYFRDSVNQLKIQ